jgi:hypothetical protein
MVEQWSSKPLVWVRFLLSLFIIVFLPQQVIHKYRKPFIYKSKLGLSTLPKKFLKFKVQKLSKYNTVLYNKINKYLTKVLQLPSYNEGSKTRRNSTPFFKFYNNTAATKIKPHQINYVSTNTLTSF